MTPRAIEDSKLVQQAAGGDQEAFADLFKQHFQAVYNYAIALTNDQASAEDLTQDAFIKAHANIHRLGPPWNFRAWIFSLLRNLHIDQLRRERTVVSLDWAKGNRDQDKSPEQQAIHQENAERVQQALLLLPEQYREALLLREFYDFPYLDIAEIMEVSHNNVKVIIHRARQEFQKAYGLQLILEEPTEDCILLHEMLSLVHDGEAQKNQSEFVKKHLKTCEECQQRQRRLTQLSQIFSVLVFIPFPEDLGTRILENTIRRPNSNEKGDIQDRGGISPNKEPLSVGAIKGYTIRFLGVFIAMVLFALYSGAITLPEISSPASDGPGSEGGPSESQPSNTPAGDDNLLDDQPLPQADDQNQGQTGGLAQSTPTSIILSTVTASATPKETPTFTSVPEPLSDFKFSTSTIYYRGNGCGPKEVTFSIISHDPEIYSVVLFYRLADASSPKITDWTAVAMGPYPNNIFRKTIHSEADIALFASFSSAYLQTQVVATDKQGDEVGRTTVISEVMLFACSR